MKKVSRKPIILGLIFGLLAPPLGLFFGLQVAPFLGNILMFPFRIIGYIIHEPLGHFSTTWWALSYFMTVLFWMFVFVVGARIFKRER